jgi:hypothetical protein
VSSAVGTSTHTSEGSRFYMKHRFNLTYLAYCSITYDGYCMKNLIKTTFRDSLYSCLHVIGDLVVSVLALFSKYLRLDSSRSHQS